MRPHEQSDALVMIALGLVICGLAVPFARSGSIWAYIALAGGAVLFLAGSIHLRRL